MHLGKSSGFSFRDADRGKFERRRCAVVDVCPRERESVCVFSLWVCIMWVYICIRYVTARKHERDRDSEREEKNSRGIQPPPAKEIFQFLFYFIPKIPRNTKWTHCGRYKSQNAFRSPLPQQSQQSQHSTREQSGCQRRTLRHETRASQASSLTFGREPARVRDSGYFWCQHRRLQGNSQASKVM